MLPGAISGFDPLFSGGNWGGLHHGGIARGRPVHPPVSSFLTVYDLFVISFSILGLPKLFLRLHCNKIPAI